MVHVGRGWSRSWAAWIAASAALCVVAVGGCQQKRCAQECDLFGLCTASATERQAASCVAANNSDCQGSKACRYYGKCSMVGHACARTSAADCQLSNKCKWAGECGFVDGKCSAVAASDCQRSKYCKDKGMCRLKAKYGGLGVCTK